VQFLKRSTKLRVGAPRFDRVINLVRMMVHIDPAAGALHFVHLRHNVYSSATFSRPYLRTFAIQISSFRNLSMRLTYDSSFRAPLSSNAFCTLEKLQS